MNNEQAIIKELHKIDKRLATQIAEIDGKLNSLNDKIDNRIQLLAKDLENTKMIVDKHDNSISWVIKTIIGAVIVAVLGLIISIK